MDAFASDAASNLAKSSLAVAITTSQSASSQSQSRLLCLPNEVLTYIWIEVLRNYKVPSKRPDSPLYPKWFRNPRYRIDLHLLSTCRMVYLQAHTLPFNINWMTSNPFDRMDEGSMDIFDINRLYQETLPWQWLALRKLFLSESQGSMEGKGLYSLAQDLRNREVFRLAGCDLNPCQSSDHDKIDFTSPMFTTPMYITNLTIHMKAESHYAPRTGLKGFDPEHLYEESLHTMRLELMKTYTRKRLGSTWSGYPSGSWGNDLGHFKGLCQFQLILEAAEKDKDDLDEIVSCAKQWRSPLLPLDSNNELLFDSLTKMANVPKNDNIDSPRSPDFWARSIFAVEEISCQIMWA